MKEYQFQVRVRYAETDQMGVVYHGNYAQYFEMGRVEWLRNMGVSYKWMEENGVMLPVVSLSMNYKKPARYDDLLTVKTILKSQTSVKIEFDYEIYNESSELLTTGYSMLVFVDMKSGRPILPPDYVNYVRISVYNDGVLRPLSENIQVMSSNSYLQDNNCNVLFDQNGDILEGTSMLDYDRLTKQNKTIYLGGGPFYGKYGWTIDGNWVFDYKVGARFGLNTETANANPTYNIDKANGVINFSSDMSDQLCILEYISDGMEGGDDSKVSVNKFFEEYIYAYIKYALLNNKTGINEYVVNRAKKDKTALLRNAKIRISNMHPGRLLMNLRGQNKWLK